MRIKELRLDRFGHFTDARLDLSGGPNLHVVCGDNEAGKTTILRAVSGKAPPASSRSVFWRPLRRQKLSLRPSLASISAPMRSSE